MDTFIKEPVIWKDIEGYFGIYKVSDKGEVKTLPRMAKRGNGTINVKERVRKAGLDKDGYSIIALHRDGNGNTKKVHRLVAQSFIDNPSNLPCVNHIDGNKSNNCVENLEWCTYKDNTIHGYDNGLISSGEDHYKAKLTNNQIKEIRSINRVKINNRSYSPTHKEIADKYGVSRSYITEVLNNNKRLR